jgi:hypothetical protein
MTRIAVLAVVAGVVLGAALVRGADPPKPAPPEGDFTGKFLVILVRSPKVEGPIHLEAVRLKRLGDQWFLVGRWIGSGAAAENRWVALSDVIAMEEFAGRDVYRKAYPSP